jgi:hypothetical protein
MTTHADNYKALVAAIAELLYRYDPMDLSGAPRDEYEPEAIAIVARLSQCSSEQSCLDLVWNVFVHFFGEHSLTPKESFAPLAGDLWKRAQLLAPRS